MVLCAVCLELIEDEEPIGAGDMLFHAGCLPRCRFCGARYDLEHGAGWDFRGGTTWSSGWGYVSKLESAACAACTDAGDRRDYGAGW